MILTDLWFSNFRKHVNLHVKLQSGVTAIVGRNGTGKSTIIEGIQFLLTGELFGGTKEEAINLDTASGYVAGSFELNGKKGRLERHLDSSKVVLTYDGVTYKKSTEVKELWDKLLQLNPEIIKKVIIARQGDIPQLFSGDPAIREKVFQRIFLVPPTEKLRSMIWKDYLKQAPPVIPEEDVLQLGNTKELLEAESRQLVARIAKLPTLSEGEQQRVRERIAYAKKCIDDSLTYVALDELQLNNGVYLREIEDKIAVVEEKLKIDIDKYRRMNTMLLQHKGLYAQKLKLEDELAKLVYPFDEKQLAARQELFDSADKCWVEANDKMNRIRMDLQKVIGELEGMVDLKGAARCPTCHQDIKDIAEHLWELEKRKERLQNDLQAHKELVNTFGTTRLDILTSIRSYEAVTLKREQLEENIAQFQDITFDEDTLQTTNAVINKYAVLKEEKVELDLLYARTLSKQESVKREMDLLSEYDREEDPRYEIDALTDELDASQENYRQKQQLTIDHRVKEAEIKALTERIKKSEENHEKNKKRNRYYEMLDKAYGVLHTSQFPRKLIMSYADIVTEYLQENLNMFDIPYKGRVADDFKIEMIDDQDRILPSVSGGQEIVIGISLHLALHDLFSQSFPLMVIDEGTTHLDTINRKAYFDMIKGLKHKSKLKQILIIDHDPQVSDVVDHVIQLKDE